MTDPIADMLTRIRNAMAVRKTDVLIPFSKIKLAIATILQQHGYVTTVEKIDVGSTGFPEIKIGLKYEGREPVIKSLKRISTPGRRLYVAKDELPVVLNNLGIAIISTSQGLMTNKQAKTKNLGGEVMCEIF